MVAPEQPFPLVRWAVLVCSYDDLGTQAYAGRVTPEQSPLNSPQSLTSETHVQVPTVIGRGVPSSSTSVDAPLCLWPFHIVGQFWQTSLIGYRSTRRPPQFLSLSLGQTGCSSIASSSRRNSATINSNRLRIAVSIIAAAKPFTRAIWEEHVDVRHGFHKCGVLSPRNRSTYQNAQIATKERTKIPPHARKVDA